MKRFNHFLFFSLIVLLSGCNKSSLPSITIAEQYGLAYAPLQIMKKKRFLEELTPETEVNWVRLGNTAAIREAVLSGDVDAGFMGIPPFLIARDQNMPWKIATGLSQAPLGLVVSDKVSSLDDFNKETRLALPQPGSIQHILLAMALEKKYGHADRLDFQLVSMKHPDGMNALLSGAVQGHFTSPPYLFQEIAQEGFSLLIDGEEAMGTPFTFIVGVITEDFYENQRDLYNDYLKALEMAVDFINDSPEETIQILADIYKMEAATLQDYLYRPGMIYETEVRGLEKFINFMVDEELIVNREKGEDVIF